MMEDTYINNGTIIMGDVHNSSFGNNVEKGYVKSTTVEINDPVAIAQLLEAAKRICPNDPTAAGVANSLQAELQTTSPKVGRLQALYDWLRRNCTVDSTLSAIKFFGKLLSKFV